MADGRIEGKDIFGPSTEQTIDGIVKGLDQMITRIQQIRKEGGQAFSPKQIDEYSKAQQRLANTAQLAANGTLDQIAAAKEEERLLKSVAREKAKAAQSNSELAKENEKLARQRRAAAASQREEEKLTKKLSTAYGRLQKNVSDLERDYKELAAAGKLNTAEGRKLTAQFNKQKTALDRINRSARDFRTNVGNYPSAFNGATTAIRGFVGAFGLIEGLRLGADFIGDSIQIAQAARGVEFAYERLGERGVAAFESIRTSTRGALSDLDIKTSINEFENFNIDLEESGVLFEFLAVRAQQTGKSIDTLRDSLVEGLSKESKLRIDNLGISTAELNEELEKTPDFVEAVANIARRELADAGDVLDTLANSPQAAQAAFENLQLTIGQLFVDFNGFGFVTNLLNQARDSVIVFANGVNNLKQGFIDAFEPLFNLLKQIPGFDKVLQIFQKLFSTLNDPIAQKIGRVFTILGAQLSGVGAAAGVIIDRFVDLFNAFRQLANVNLDNPLAFINSLKENASNLVDVLGDGAGQSTAEAYQGAYTRALKDSQERTNASLKKTFADPIKPEGEVGRAIVDNVKDSFVEALAEAEKFAQALTTTLGDDRNEIVSTEDVDRLTQIANGLDTVAEKNRQVLDESREAQEAIRNSALAVVNELETSTGVSFELIRDLINGTSVETADFLSFTGQATQAILESQTARIDAQIQQNNAALQAELANTRLTEEQKQQLRERYAQQEARLKRRQAQQNKRNALFEIAVNTAVAVSKALSQLGAFSFGAIAPILAQGLAQSAIVASRPLPQFFKGKGPLDNYEGWATVGEKGREVLVRDGQAFVTPDKTTPTFVKRDDIIYPSIREFENKHLAENGTFEATQLRNQMDQRLQFDFERFQKAVENALKKTNIQVNNKVIVEQKRLKW